MRKRGFAYSGVGWALGGKGYVFIDLTCINEWKHTIMSVMSCAPRSLKFPVSPNLSRHVFPPSLRLPPEPHIPSPTTLERHQMTGRICLESSFPSPRHRSVPALLFAPGIALVVDGGNNKSGSIKNTPNGIAGEPIRMLVELTIVTFVRIRLI
jgi:hypothetical protein